jgi:hypothetical protein
MKTYKVLIWVLVILALNGIYYNYVVSTAYTSNKEFSLIQQVEARRLAIAHCQSCHLFPESYQVDKFTWTNHILTMKVHTDLIDTSQFAQDSLLVSTLAPTKGWKNIPDVRGTITLDEWEKLVRYYQTNAPVSSLPQPPRPNIRPTLQNFEILTPPFTIRDPDVNLVKLDTMNDKLFIADAQRKQLIAYDQFSLNPTDTMDLGSKISQINYFEARYFVLAQGDRSHPSGNGEFIRLGENNEPELLIADLPMPNHASHADLNKDHRKDVVICSDGKIAWYQRLPSGFYREHILGYKPGAICSAVADFNNDGWLDVMVLTGKGDESLYIYYNLGRWAFREHRIKRFVPAWNNSYFELADFNNDGLPDILMTSGLSSQYPPVMKFYQGIRIYINKGRNHFEESYFFPVNGAYKASAVDFDQDGDLDIVCVAHVPDYVKSPEESFVYLENLGGKFNFKPHTFPESNMSRWSTFDIGDIDNDGDMDIILGAAVRDAGYVPERFTSVWRQGIPPFTILVNQLKQPSTNLATQGSQPSLR